MSTFYSFSFFKFQYGEDSLAVEKTPFITPNQFPFLIDNYPIITSDQQELEIIRKVCHHDYIDKKIVKTREWHLEHKNLKGGRCGPFYNFSKMMSDNDTVSAMKLDERVKYISGKWNDLTRDEKKVYKRGNSL